MKKKELITQWKMNAEVLLTHVTERKPAHLLLPPLQQPHRLALRLRLHIPPVYLCLFLAVSANNEEST